MIDGRAVRRDTTTNKIVWVSPALLDLDAVPRDVRVAVRHLVELCLVGVRPGAGQRASEYLLALPKTTVASLSTAAVEDVPAPPF